jgi:hypothetical protein
MSKHVNISRGEAAELALLADEKIEVLHVEVDALVSAEVVPAGPAGRRKNTGRG